MASYSRIKIELIKDFDANEITANLEYNIVILGKEGKFIITNLYSSIK